MRDLVITTIGHVARATSSARHHEREVSQEPVKVVKVGLPRLTRAQRERTEHEPTTGDLLNREGGYDDRFRLMRAKPYQRQGLRDLLDYTHGKRLGTTRLAPSAGRRGGKHRAKRVAVELGSYSGESLSIMAGHGTFKKIICVDKWSEYSSVAEPLFDEVVASLQLSHPELEVVKRKMTTNRAHKRIRDKSVDLVYIDALHTYDAVRQDIFNWIPKVKLYGYLAGHDYSWRFAGVIRAIYELLGKPDIVFGDGSWAVHITPTMLRQYKQRLVRLEHADHNTDEGFPTEQGDHAPLSGSLSTLQGHRRSGEQDQEGGDGDSESNL